MEESSNIGIHAELDLKLAWMHLMELPTFIFFVLEFPTCIRNRHSGNSTAYTTTRSSETIEVVAPANMQQNQWNTILSG